VVGGRGVRSRCVSEESLKVVYWPCRNSLDGRAGADANRNRRFELPGSKCFGSSPDSDPTFSSKSSSNANAEADRRTTETKSEVTRSSVLPPPIAPVRLVEVRERLEPGVVKEEPAAVVVTRRLLGPLVGRVGRSR
jgi:hypothetical protein